MALLCLAPDFVASIDVCNRSAWKNGIWILQCRSCVIRWHGDDRGGYPQMKRLLSVVAVATLWPMALWANEVFTDVQYISGRAGFDQKIKGSLELTSSEMIFKDNKGNAIFSVPLSIIKAVTNLLEENPGSTGAKIMLGVFARKKEEFLYVNTESSSAAEAIVFKCKNKTSHGMVAKFQFQMKKSAEPTTTAPAAPGPSPADSTKRDSVKSQSGPSPADSTKRDSVKSQ